MLVTRENFDEIVGRLSRDECLALDTETTGLRPYHGDRLFSLIIANAETSYYFNFHEASDIEPKAWLNGAYLKSLSNALFTEPRYAWFLSNAKYDMHILSQEGIELGGSILCTQIMGRVERNDHFDYGLDESLKRLGLAKDDAPKKYVKEHKLFTTVPLVGKKETYEIQHYDKIPASIIIPYGEMDGRGTRVLGEHLINSIKTQDKDSPPNKTLQNIVAMEQRLTKTVFRMERQGVRIDIPYCKRAAAYEASQQEKFIAEFKQITGESYKQSPNLFKQVFASEKEKWSYTDKGNPSFDSDSLEALASPAAATLLRIRDAKSKGDFYNGFLFHADKNGVVHPDFNSGGTIHGRFSSRNPNFQNLKKDEDDDLGQEFVVRRAVVPHPGFVLIAPDYDQMEYKFLMENACVMLGFETPLTSLAKSGLDFHEATSQNVEKYAHKHVSRRNCKIANFLSLYGGGVSKLAISLGVPENEARQIRDAIFKSAPEIREYIDKVGEVARTRGYIINWLGRRSHFPIPRFAYRAPNYHISGGCADIVKTAMNQIDEYLLDKKSRMIMTVHDELPIEVHESEIDFVPKVIHEIMQRVFTSKYLPLTASMEWSDKSLADKIKGYPI